MFLLSFCRKTASVIKMVLTLVIKLLGSCNYYFFCNSLSFVPFSGDQSSY